MVLRWQVSVTLAFAAVAGLWVGKHGFVSALLGGAVITLAYFVYAVVISFSRTGSPGEVLRTMVRAGGIKFALIVTQLWIVLKAYPHLAPLAFFLTFIVTVLISSIGLLVREKPQA